MARRRKLGLIITVTAMAVLVLIETLRVSITRNRYNVARAEIAELQTALNRYYLDNGAYPTTDQGLEALAGSYIDAVVPDAVDPGMLYPHPTAKRLLLDAWGRPFHYESDGKSYPLESFGAGGVNAMSHESSLIVRSPRRTD